MFTFLFLSYVIDSSYIVSIVYVYVYHVFYIVLFIMNIVYVHRALF